MSRFLILMFSSLLVLPVFAGTKLDASRPGAPVKKTWNPITIYNDTTVDIAYVMMGSYGGAVYGVKQGATDIYHSGTGDEYATFSVGICDNLAVNGGSCTQYRNLSTCTQDHYNADLIQSIHVLPGNGCRVTCLDGGQTSCRQSG